MDTALLSTENVSEMCESIDLGDPFEEYNLGALKADTDAGKIET
jgi:hypothetical protein